MLVERFPGNIIVVPDEPFHQWQCYYYITSSPQFVLWIIRYAAVRSCSSSSIRQQIMGWKMVLLFLRHQVSQKVDCTSLFTNWFICTSTERIRPRNPLHDHQTQALPGTELNNQLVGNALLGAGSIFSSVFYTNEAVIILYFIFHNNAPGYIRSFHQPVLAPTTRMDGVFSSK